MALNIVHPRNDGTLFKSHIKRARDVQSAELLLEPPIAIPHRGRTSAQREGRRYEKKVLRFLADKFHLVVPGPWIRFADASGADRLCQPDALVFSADLGKVVILEVKKIHNLDAWFQLRKLYGPVVKALYPEAEVSACEVTAAFDPRKPWPEPVAFCDEPGDIMELGPIFGVYQWRK